MSSSDNLRQRRGTKSSNGTTSATTTTTTTTTTTNTTSGPSATSSSSANKPTPTDQLKHAHARLIVARDRTADLHAVWRGQLFRLSFLILFLSVYQLQTSISTCVTEIKGVGENDITGVQAIKIIFTDSFCELLGVIISSLLAYFLAASTKTTLDLDYPAYMVCSVLIPICLGIYFQSERVGCFVYEDNDNNNMKLDKIQEVDDKRHQFPAAVIYHTIVTVAFWFMKQGMKHCEGKLLWR